MYVTNRLRIEENIAISILFIFSSDTVGPVVPKLYSTKSWGIVGYSKVFNEFPY